MISSLKILQLKSIPLDNRNYHMVDPLIIQVYRCQPSNLPQPRAVSSLFPPFYSKGVCWSCKLWSEEDVCLLFGIQYKSKIQNPNPRNPFGIVSYDQRKTWSPLSSTADALSPGQLFQSPQILILQHQNQNRVNLGNKCIFWNRISDFTEIHLKKDCFLLSGLLQQADAVWSIPIWSIFRYLGKTNSHWWSDQHYWTWIKKTASKFQQNLSFKKIGFRILHQLQQLLLNHLSKV